MIKKPKKFERFKKEHEWRTLSIDKTNEWRRLWSDISRTNNKNDRNTTKISTEQKSQHHMEKKKNKITVKNVGSDDIHEISWWNSKRFGNMAIKNTPGGDKMTK